MTAATSEAAPELPHVDEHTTVVAADPEQVWTALGHVVGRSRGDPARALARLLDVDPGVASGDPLVAGSSIVGFRVARAKRPQELLLRGRHRFSTYELAFRVDATGPGATRLRAETRAVFPGVGGRAYRALVIGTRGHVVAVRRLLASTRRRAESAGSPPPRTG